MSSVKIPSIVSGAYQLHNRKITGKDITVAILDSGLAPHKDIHPNRILAFRDFIKNEPHLYDDFSHGTHVTGILASSNIGIAPECLVISLKVLDHKGNGSTDIFIRAIRWLLDNYHRYNIRIVNISIGGTIKQLNGESYRLNQWVSHLWEHGLTVCCSAGNMGPSPNSITVPGTCKPVITVGSADGKHFSSAGPPIPHITKPELVSYGTKILSMKPHGGYSIKNGTSMSVPFISGACALMLQQQHDLSNEQLKSHLIHAAYPVPYLPYNMQGAGMVDFQKLILSPQAPPKI